MVLFLVLALPLRKDQPMETYLAAMIRFFFAPRTRLWDPDGSEMMVEITNPRIDDDPISQKIKGDEAVSRLSMLSEIEDSQGWVTRGIINNTSLNDDLVATAGQADDILENGSVADQFSSMLSKSDEDARKAVISRMNQTREEIEEPKIIAPAPAVNIPVIAQNDVSQQPVSPQNSSQAPMNIVPQAPTISIDEEAAASAFLDSRKQAEPQDTMRGKVINPLQTQPAQPRIPAPIAAQNPVEPQAQQVENVQETEKDIPENPHNSPESSVLATNDIEKIPENPEVADKEDISAEKSDIINEENANVSQIFDQDSPNSDDDDEFEINLH